MRMPTSAMTPWLSAPARRDVGHAPIPDPAGRANVGDPVRRNIAVRGVALITLAQFLTLSCTTKTTPTTPAGGGGGGSSVPGNSRPLELTNDPGPGLTLRLSDGHQ